MNYMKTLIIHPDDKSTDFLCPIYQTIEDKTVVRKGLTKKEVAEKIKIHNRIIMLGHGSPDGLFAVGQFETDNSFIIDSTLTEILAEKDENIYIWCHANQFVEKHNLKGFYTGMFVSEILEALYCDLPFVEQKLVDESNDGFSKIVSNYINESKSTIYNKTLDEYQAIANNNLVAAYNIVRINSK
jgi:hypothetical protein